MLKLIEVTDEALYLKDLCLNWINFAVLRTQHCLQYSLVNVKHLLCSDQLKETQEQKCVVPTNVHRNVNIQANTLYAMHQLLINSPEAVVSFMAAKANTTTKPTFFSVFIAVGMQRDTENDMTLPWEVVLILLQNHSWPRERDFSHSCFGTVGITYTNCWSDDQRDCVKAQSHCTFSCDWVW